MIRSFVFLPAAMAAACLSAAEPTADLILHGGRVVTVDAAMRVVEALAVRNGRILAVGTNDEVLRLRGEKTETIDLAGKAVRGTSSIIRFRK